jgi:MoxR-like ATPase
VTNLFEKDPVLAPWLERDLSRAAQAGELLPNYELEELLERAADSIDSGRHPVLSGESGVGKTALIHEIVLRAHAGRGFAALQGKHVLQLSIRQRVSGLAKPENVRPEMQKLVAHLLQQPEHLVPYFRDLHLAYTYDLEPQLEMLGLRFDGPMLGEGERSTLDAMFESTPALEEHYLMLPIEEPDLGRMEQILASWAQDQARVGRRFGAAALAAALELGHRFLARSRNPRKTLELLSQVAALTPEREVSETDVIARFQQAYKVPRLLIDPGVSFDAVALEKSFRASVLEQTEAVEAVVRVMSTIKAGLADTRRPFGAFLFVGPTGVGKTHIAQMLAEFLFGSRERLVRINMADYPKLEDALLLFGNSDAYAVRQRRGLLTVRLMGHPFAVLLLDEFEKAHEVVHDRFLQLIDEGLFINGAGESVSCRSIIVIATSNAGAEVYRGHSIGFSGAREVAHLDQEVDRILYKRFRIEFLNRFDQIVHFHPLSRAGIRTIALREIEYLQGRSGLRRRDLTLEIDEGVLDWLASHGYHPEFGARFLKRTIERHVTTALAELLVADPPEPGSSIILGVRHGRIAARQAEPPAESDRVQPVSLPVGTAARTVHLDRAAVLRESEALLERALPRLQALQERLETRRNLLELMNRQDFWSEPAEAQRVLDGFRKLDIVAELERRLSGPIERLRALLDTPLNKPVRTQDLTRALQFAARALHDWDERLALEGPSAVWLVLRNLDPLHEAGEFIEQLVRMELAWCRRLNLSCELVGYGESDGSLARAAIEVEGPGAANYLAMEHGVHRMHRANRADLKVQIAVVAKRDAPAAEPARLYDVRPRAGALELAVTCVGRFEREASGLVLEFFGASRTILGQLLMDLENTHFGENDNPTAARAYAHAGAGARDPRTGAVIPRFKDVLDGKLDPLLEAWRQRTEDGRELSN